MQCNVSFKSSKQKISRTLELSWLKSQRYLANRNTMQINVAVNTDQPCLADTKGDKKLEYFVAKFKHRRDFSCFFAPGQGSSGCQWTAQLMQWAMKDTTQQSWPCLFSALQILPPNKLEPRRVPSIYKSMMLCFILLFIQTSAAALFSPRQFSTVYRAGTALGPPVSCRQP